MSSRDSRTRVVRFGDVVRQVKETADPESSGLERYVAGEHMDTDELQVTRWGKIGDGYLGPAFHRRFRSGQILYGSRRTYLRKVALADFDGICANTTLVLETKDVNVLLPELLPFVMQSEDFHAHSIAQSKGSVNPYVNWSDLTWYEFSLPPIDEQREIAEVLWAAERLSRAYSTLLAKQAVAAPIYMQTRLANARTQTAKLGELVDGLRPLCYGVVQPGQAADDGVPLIRVCDLEGSSLDMSALRTISRRVHEEYKRSVVRPGDVLVSVVGTIGRTIVVPEEADGVNIARAVARIAPDITKLVPEFLVEVLRTTTYQRKLMSAGFESARRTLNLGRLSEIEIPLPTLSVQREIVDSATGWRRATEEARKQLENLRRMRDGVVKELIR